MPDAPAPEPEASELAPPGPEAAELEPPEPTAFELARTQWPLVERRMRRLLLVPVGLTAAMDRFLERRPA